MLLSPLLAACGSAAASRLPRAVTASLPPLLHLPGDQRSHPSASSEWWYIVGHVHSGSRTFGYETTIFKFLHIRPPGFSFPVTIYRTDIAITDERAQRFHQQVTYYFPQSASLSSRDLRVDVGSAALSGALSNMNLKARFKQGALSMNLSSRRPPMYVGGRGYIPFGNGYTYYYSLTDLATRGTLTLGGRSYSVTGVSWLDHQWGNWSWAAVRGWTWMALQLNNGIQLSIFDFRSTGQRVKAASVLLPNGHTATIYHATITSTGSWRSPHTHGVYPSGWIVRIPSVRATLQVKPTVRDQELAIPAQARGSYWEGSGTIKGTYAGRAVGGFSYTELTGYAKG